MNGKIALILSILALLGVGYLIVNKPTAKKSIDTTTQDSLVVEEPVKTLNIAFINNDSLYLKSQYILDKQDELLKAQRKAQRKVERKTKKAEDEVAKMYQEAASYTTQQQQQDAQDKYLKLQEDLQKLQEREAEKLSKLQIKSNEKLMKKLDGYFNEFCAEHHIDYLFTKGPGLSFLYGNQSSDMTEEFIDEINQKYQVEQDSIKLEKEK